MDNKTLCSVISDKIQKDLFAYQAYEDFYGISKLTLAEDKDFAVANLKWLSETISERMPAVVGRDLTLGRKMMGLHRKVLLAAARDDFDSFMLALEFNRPPQEAFWRPRRKHLMPICQALQDMENDKLDELFLSCPPRIGKTSLVVMFIIWVMGRNSERSNLYCSFTSKPVETFYDGLLEVLKDPVTYQFNEIFRESKLVATNANDATIDLDRKKRYHSFTGRPIGGSLNGSCDSNGYIVADDLVSGIEEAMSKERMANLWFKVDNTAITRAKEQCKRLWIGTRWALSDPQQIRIDLLKNEPKYASVRWKYINTPALNEKEESNFDFQFGVGFSTAYYQMRRASFERNNDMASWLAQYQGEPIERDGAVFAPEDLRYYNGTLPDADPDRIFMAVDPAWGGGDFVSAPIIYQYGDDLFVADVVYNNGDKRVTQPLIVRKAIEHNVQAIYIEATRTTASFTQEVDALLASNGYKVNLQSTTKHYTGTGKEQRIFDRAPEIREMMIFLESGKRHKEYEMFMQNMFAFSIARKNKNDDSVDSLAIALSMAIFGGSNKVKVIPRLW